MLETAAPQEMQKHYDCAHKLRARAFAETWAGFVAVSQRKQKGPRLAAQPQYC